MREASVRRTKPPAGNPRCGSVPCGADRRGRATKQAAAAAGPGPTPRGVWSRYPAARGLFCYVLLWLGGGLARLACGPPRGNALWRVPERGAEALPLVLPALDDDEAGLFGGVDAQTAHLLEDLLQSLICQVIDPELVRVRRGHARVGGVHMNGPHIAQRLDEVGHGGEPLLLDGLEDVPGLDRRLVVGVIGGKGREEGRDLRGRA